MYQGILMSKRIAVITTVHNINDSRIFFKQIQSFLKAGYAIEYIVKRGNPAINNEGISYHFLKNKEGIITRLRNILASFKYSLKLNANLFILHDPELIPIGVLLKILRKKVVYDIHELYFNTLKSKPYLSKHIANIITTFYKIIEQVSIRFFDGIILAESAYEPFYKKYNYVIIQNYVLRQFIKSGIPVKRKNKISFLYLGSITRKRGIFEILYLANFLKDQYNVEFHIIGPIYELKLEEEVNNYISEKDLSQIVTLHGRLPLTEIEQIMDRCQFGLILLHPMLNFETSYPTKLFEYMARGLIVIMSNIPLWEEFNEKYKCGITIELEHFEQEITNILNLIQNEELQKTIRHSNIRNVEKHFIWDLEEKKLLSFIDNILSE